MTTLTKTQTPAVQILPAPFSDCSFSEKICTEEKKFPEAAEEAAVILRQKGLGSAIITCQSNGGTISNLDPSDRFIVDLNHMRTTNPAVYKDITAGHFAVFYLCKKSPEVVVLKTAVIRGIIKDRTKKTDQNPD